MKRANAPSHMSPRHASVHPSGSVPYARSNILCSARVNDVAERIRITMLTQVTALSTSPESAKSASTLRAAFPCRSKRSLIRSARSSSPGPNAEPTTRKGISEVNA